MKLISLSTTAIILLLNLTSCSSENFNSDTNAQNTFAQTAPQLTQLSPREANTGGESLYIDIQGTNLNADPNGLTAKLKSRAGTQNSDLTLKVQDLTATTARLILDAGVSIAEGAFDLVIGNAYGDSTLPIATLKGDKGDGCTIERVAGSDDAVITCGSTAIQIAGGVQGPKGDKGDKGEQGNPGMPGPVGPQGPKGDKGDQGIQGLMGVAGKDGSSCSVQKLSSIATIACTDGTMASLSDGLQGPKGDKGEQGIQGPQGLRGDKGDKGDSGADGLPGPQGTAGKPGASCTVSKSGTVSTITCEDGRIATVEDAIKDRLTIDVLEGRAVQKRVRVGMYDFAYPLKRAKIFISRLECAGYASVADTSIPFYFQIVPSGGGFYTKYGVDPVYHTDVARVRSDYLYGAFFQSTENLTQPFLLDTSDLPLGTNPIIFVRSNTYNSQYLECYLTIFEY